jgi:hypothetical protein
MSGASHILDPVEAARDDVSESKRLIASTLEDLSRHHSWLESYHREERRRTERLRRQDALRRLERKGQRTAWRAWRFAVTCYAVTRAAIAVLARNGRAFVIWAAPKVSALALAASSVLSAAARWSWRTGRSLAREGFALSADAFAWSVRASDKAGVIFRRHLAAYAAFLSTRAAILAAPALRRASISWIRTRYRTRRFAFGLETSLSHGWSETQSAVSRWFIVETPKLRRLLAREVAAGAARTRRRARGFWRAALKTGADRWSWAALRAKQILERSSAAKHRALIVRPSTALVCVEAWRARLPVIRPS